MIKKYKEIIILMVSLIAISQLYLYTMFPAFNNDDSPETIASAYTLGISHPPGYPLFTMAGKVFSLLPIGSPAFRINSFAIFLAILVLLLSYYIIKQITFNILNYENKIIDFFGVFILAFSYIFWNQAIEAKGGIYILNLLFLAILIYLSIKLFKGFNPASRKSQPAVEAGIDSASGREHIEEPMKAGSSAIKYLYLMSFIYGLSLCNHWPSMIILLPVFGYIFFIYRQKINQKNTITIILLLLAGLSPYLYLPVRAGTDGIFVFMARPNTWEYFWWTVLRTAYGNPTPPTLQLYENQIKEFFTLLFNNYSILWILMFAGGYTINKKSKNLFYFYLSAVLIIIFAVVFYNHSEERLLWVISIFLMPFQYILLLFLTAGMHFILGFFKQKTFKYIFLAVIFLFILFIGYKNFKKNNSRYNYQAYDFGNNILKTLDKDSLYFCEDDFNFIPLYYIQIIEKQRQDVKLASVFPLFFKWGIDNFVKKYGNIPLKEKDPSYNLSNIITYYSNNNIKIFKSTNSPLLDNLKGYNFKQIGLLQEYLKNDKPMSPKIFELYSYNRGLYDKYIEYSKQTLDLVVFYLYCMMLQGEDLLHDGNPAGALKLYKKAMLFPYEGEMKENKPIFYYKLSYIYKDLNDKDNQIKYLNKAIGLKHDYWQAYQELGIVYFKDGNLKMAKEMFENAKNYGSHDSKVLELVSSDNNKAGKYLQSGDAENSSGDYKEAIEDYNRAIEIDPKYAETYCNRGVARYHLGDKQGALKDLNKAIELNQRYAVSYYNRGIVKNNLGDKQGAIEDLNKAGELGLKQAYDMIKKIQGD